MSYNYLSKALSRVAQAEGQYNTFVGTKFARHMSQAINGVNELASQRVNNTSLAYSAYLKNTGQSVSTEIKDRKKYAESLKDNIQIDPSYSQAANESLHNQIQVDNEEAYRLTKIIKNPLRSKKKKIQATNDLERIKSNFNTYKKDRDIVTALITKSIDSQKNPDPSASLFEMKIHTELLDGSFKDRIVYNPEIEGEKKVGGYYKRDDQTFVKLEDLRTVNKVDLEFEESLAGIVTEATELSRKSKWNESSRRELLSTFMKLAKSNPDALRPVIFNGFTADEIDGEEESYANVFLEKQVADAQNESRGVSIDYDSETIDIMRDELKSEDLTEGFMSYFISLVDEAAAGSAPDDGEGDGGSKGRKATPLSVMERAMQEQFVKNVDDPNQNIFKMFNSTDKVIKEGNKFFMANSKGVKYDSMPPMTRDQLLNSGGLAVPYETSSTSSNNNPFDSSDQNIDKLIQESQNSNKQIT